MLSVIDRFSKDLPEVNDDSSVYDLSVCARAELCMLATLAPLCKSNLRAGFADKLYATDASPFGLGATSIPIAETASAELYRRRERRGHYTAMHSKDVASMYARGLIQEDELETPKLGPDRLLVETFDYFAICCGQSSPLLNACIS